MLKMHSINQILFRNEIVILGWLKFPAGHKTYQHNVTEGKNWGIITPPIQDDQMNMTESVEHDQNIYTNEH